MQTLIDEALEAYGMSEAETCLIRHNENLIYKVNHKGNDYVYRIHQHIEEVDFSIFGPNMYSPARILAEMKILKEYSCYLGRTLFQCPMENREGKLVTLISDNIPVTVLEWVEGYDLECEENISDETLYQIGQLVANMHKASKEHLAAMTFDRPVYNKERVDQLLTFIYRGVKNGIYSEKVWATAEEAAKEIGVRMQELDDRKQTYGLIHSDLNRSNLIKTKDKLIPIDFCLSAYGYYYHDLGSLLLDINEEKAQDILIRGYESISGQTVERRYIETFEVYQTLLYLAAQAKHETDTSWLPEHLFD